MDEAEKILDSAEKRVAVDWRNPGLRTGRRPVRQHQRRGPGVPRHQAIGVDRGATLDTLEVPLGNRVWLKQRFAVLRGQTDEAERLKGLREIVNWTDPGPGGFYDDLGKLHGQPHLIVGPGFAHDPAFLESSHTGFAGFGPMCYSWKDHAEAMLAAPLRLRYERLDPEAHYKMRVVYGGDGLDRKIRCEANDGIEIHPLIAKQVPVGPIEFDIPLKRLAAALSICGRIANRTWEATVAVVRCRKSG